MNSKIFLLQYFKGSIVYMASGRTIAKNVPLLGVTHKLKKEGRYSYPMNLNYYEHYPEDRDSQFLESDMILFVRKLNLQVEESLNSSKEEGYVKDKEDRFVKGRKVLICKDDLFIEESILKSSKWFDFEFVDRKRIHDAIMNKEKVVVYYFVKSGEYVHHTLINADNGDYFAAPMSGLGERYKKKIQKTTIFNDAWWDQREENSRKN